MFGQLTGRYGRGITRLGLLAVGVSAICNAAAQDPFDLLPDMTVVRGYLNDTSIVTDVEPGRIHLRLSNATANIGEGPMFVTRIPSKQDELREDILQRVSRSDGSTYERLAGTYIFHPEHGHVHVEGWAQYRLREVIGDDGVGDIVAEGEKTSFCLWDVLPNDLTLPNAPQFREFTECNFGVQGISVGWADLYDKYLPNQWIDITDIPAGEYWLESDVDPDNAFLELDETNNIVRARVTIPPGLTGCPAWHDSASTAGQGDMLSLFGVPVGLVAVALLRRRTDKRIHLG